jgi:hypothetical protein
LPERLVWITDLPVNVGGPTSLSLFAAAIYAGVVLSCLAAALVAVRTRQDSSHGICWVTLAAFFAVLVFLRVTNLEELWRAELRDILRTGGYYEGRRNFQGPISAGVLIIITLSASLWIARKYRFAKGRRGAAVITAQVGALLMAGTMALRMVSFSPVDKLLYGPLKLNWIGDLGSTFLVAGCAAYYIHLARRSFRREHPR